eukprot:CAMPEP_0184739642 /NCGR_PEP_ID=MMETSP0315-20130426/2561_1 /TAXON_ID=101924 /ORGANISM="Rhodosorus marinus, Strain UTEX LB 2760" /LENGTH=54 /DNA_ID=CAMNT_0027208669 /DNA_START=225 /DNA_END=389 /DNA_ORIENTATION=+
MTPNYHVHEAVTGFQHDRLWVNQSGHHPCKFSIKFSKCHGSEPFHDKSPQVLAN